MPRPPCSTPAPALAPSRRRMLRGCATLSAVAVALLSGRESLAQGQRAATAQDLSILNIALGLEHEAINAYQLGATSGLLQKPVFAMALQFQGHHKSHRDTLIATIRKLGGTPLAERPLKEYAKGLQSHRFKSQTDVLVLAARLELGATNAYLGAIPSIGDRRLAQVAGRLAADETMHYTALNAALGQLLPAGALSFGT